MERWRGGEVATCAVCLGVLAEPALQCTRGHGFCASCLIFWTSTRTATCPCCRCCLLAPRVNGLSEEEDPNEAEAQRGGGGEEEEEEGGEQEEEHGEGAHAAAAAAAATADRVVKEASQVLWAAAALFEGVSILEAVFAHLPSQPAATQCAVLQATWRGLPGTHHRLGPAAHSGHGPMDGSSMGVPGESTGARVHFAVAAHVPETAALLLRKHDKDGLGTPGADSVTLHALLLLLALTENSSSSSTNSNGGTGHGEWIPTVAVELLRCLRDAVGCGQATASHAMALPRAERTLCWHVLAVMGATLRRHSNTPHTQEQKQQQQQQEDDVRPLVHRLLLGSEQAMRQGMLVLGDEWRHAASHTCTAPASMQDLRALYTPQSSSQGQSTCHICKRLVCIHMVLRVPGDRARAASNTAMGNDETEAEAVVLAQDDDADRGESDADAGNLWGSAVQAKQGWLGARWLDVALEHLPVGELLAVGTALPALVTLLAALHRLLSDLHLHRGRTSLPPYADDVLASASRRRVDAVRILVAHRVPFAVAQHMRRSLWWSRGPAELSMFNSLVLGSLQMLLSVQADDPALGTLVAQQIRDAGAIRASHHLWWTCQWQRWAQGLHQYTLQATTPPSTGAPLPAPAPAPAAATAAAAAAAAEVQMRTQILCCDVTDRTKGLAPRPGLYFIGVIIVLTLGSFLCAFYSPLLGAIPSVLGLHAVLGDSGGLPLVTPATAAVTLAAKRIAARH